MTTGPVIVKLRVEGFGHARKETIHIPRAEWDGMTQAERRQRLEVEQHAFAAQFIYWSWQIDDPDDLDSCGFLIPEPGKANQ